MEHGEVHLGVLNEAYRGVLAELLTATSLDDVADMVARWARIALGAEGASVTRIESDSYLYTATSGAPAPPLGQRRPLAGSFTGKVVDARQGRFFHLDAEPGSRARAREEGIVSGLVVPILIADRVVGTVGVTSSREGVFGAAAMDALVGFAEHLAVALALRATADQAAARRLVTRGEELLATSLDPEQRALAEAMLVDARALVTPAEPRPTRSR